MFLNVVSRSSERSAKTQTTDLIAVTRDFVWGMRRETGHA